MKNSTTQLLIDDIISVYEKEHRASAHRDEHQHCGETAVEELGHLLALAVGARPAMRGCRATNKFLGKIQRVFARHGMSRVKLHGRMLVNQSALHHHLCENVKLVRFCDYEVGHGMDGNMAVNIKRTDSLYDNGEGKRCGPRFAERLSGLILGYPESAVRANDVLHELGHHSGFELQTFLYVIGLEDDLWEYVQEAFVHRPDVLHDSQGTIAPIMEFLADEKIGADLKVRVLEIFGEIRAQVIEFDDDDGFLDGWMPANDWLKQLLLKNRGSISGMLQAIHDVPEKIAKQVPSIVWYRAGIPGTNLEAASFRGFIDENGAAPEDIRTYMARIAKCFEGYSLPKKIKLA
ncbi:MAG: hypothetical protein WCJ29_06285 [bacterium]